MRRSPEIFHHTHSITVSQCINAIYISFQLSAFAWKLNCTTLLAIMTDPDTHASILSANVSLPQEQLFSLVAYYKHNHSPVFRVSRRKKKQKKERKLLNKPRRSISGIAASGMVSLLLIWTFCKRYIGARCYTQIRVYSQSHLSRACGSSLQAIRAAVVSCVHSSGIVIKTSRKSNFQKRARENTSNVICRQWWLVSAKGWKCHQNNVKKQTITWRKKIERDW